MALNAVLFRGCKLVRVTARAALVAVGEADGKQVWFPRSQIYEKGTTVGADDSTLNDVGDLCVTEWIVQQKIAAGELPAGVLHETNQTEFSREERLRMADRAREKLFPPRVVE